MRNEITTSNIAEVLYLLDRNHEITQASLSNNGPYGINDLYVTLTGRDIDLDHKSFLSGNDRLKLSQMETAFSAVMNVIHLQEEEAFLRGPL